MRTNVVKWVGLTLLAPEVALLLSACGPFSNTPHRTIPTVYRDPGVANTPTDSGNPPYVLSPYAPTSDVQWHTP